MERDKKEENTNHLIERIQEAYEKVKNSESSLWDWEFLEKDREKARKILKNELDLINILYNAIIEEAILLKESYEKEDANNPYRYLSEDLREELYTSYREEIEELEKARKRLEYLVRSYSAKH